MKEEILHRTSFYDFYHEAKGPKVPYNKFYQRIWSGCDWERALDPKPLKKK